MRRHGYVVRLVALGALLAALAAAFLLVVRPWYQRWGASDEETRRALPGDDIVPGSTSQETRAITIAAPVEHVWPWIAQLGQDRGGFYSFDLLENLVGCEMPIIDRLRPESLQWRPGDKLWMYPPDKAGGVGFATLRAYVPGRAIGFGTHAPGTPTRAPEDGSWSFLVEPIDAQTTRLLVRGRGAGGRSLLGAAFDRAVFEPIHFTMERRMMIGIKQLAEGHDRRRLANHVHVLLWTIVFGAFIGAALLVLVGRRWERALAATATAAVVFQILTLGQPPLVVGGALTAGVVAALGWSWRGGPTARAARR